MSEPARIRPVPAEPDVAGPDAPQSLSASGWQDVLNTAAGTSPEVAATSLIGYVVHELNETVRAYIGEKGQTDRERIKAQSSSPAPGDAVEPPEG